MAITAHRIPVVGSLGYKEHLDRVPPTFTATLLPEPENRYFRHAIAVVVNDHKVGYVAPEIAANVYEQATKAAPPMTCPGRRSSPSDHATSGVELLLDFSEFPASASA